MCEKTINKGCIWDALFASACARKGPMGSSDIPLGLKGSNLAVEL